MLAKSWRQTECVSLPVSTPPLRSSVNPLDSLMLRTVIGSAKNKGGGGNVETEVTRRCAMVDNGVDDNWSCYEVHFSLQPDDRATDLAYYHIHSAVQQTR